MSDREFSSNTICYEAIQRKYRNSIVRHIRLTFREKFPDDYLERVRKPFAKEWEALVQSAQLRGNTGQLSASIADDFDYLGVNHFYNLFDVYFDDLVPRPSNASEQARKEQRSFILGKLKAVRDLRDPLSHPGEQDFPLEDAFSIIDSARRVLEQIGLPEAVDLHELARKLLADGMDVDVPVPAQKRRSPLSHNLPSAETIAIEFIGRQNEIETLWDWFNDNDRRRWALMGDGGKGKTAIAFEFAKQVRDNAQPPFEQVIWLTAKKRKFERGDVLDQTADFWDLESAINKILGLFGLPNELLETVKEKRQRLIKYLQVIPALVIADDIDSLVGLAEDAIELITLDIPTTGSKVLLTSRRTFLGFGNATTIVSGFSPEEGNRFIDSRIRRLRLDPNVFSAEAREKIIATCDGSPLYIEDLLRFCSVGIKTEEAIKVWKNRGGAEARKYSLQRELELLSPGAQAVLIACSISGNPISFAEIRTVTELSDQLLELAINELQGLFLVPQPRIIGDVERFDVNLNTRLLVRSTLGQTEVYRKIDAASEAVSGEFDASFEVLTERTRKVKAYIKQADLLVKQNEHAHAEETLKDGLLEFPSNAELLGMMGWLYWEWRPTARLTDAREQFRRSSDLNCHNAWMYYRWWKMECEEEEWGAAALAAEIGVEKLNELPSGSVSKARAQGIETQIGTLPLTFTFPSLLYCAGYAHSRLGKALTVQSQSSALEEVAKAQVYLERELEASPRGYNKFTRTWRSDSFLSLALTLENRCLLLEAASRVGDKTELNTNRLKLKQVIAQWNKEAEVDRFFPGLSARLEKRFYLSDFDSGS